MPTYDIISYLWAKRDIQTAKEEGQTRGRRRARGWCVIGSNCGKMQMGACLLAITITINIDYFC